MTQEGFKRKLTAILSADAVGYSRLMGEDEEATVRTIKNIARSVVAYRVLIEPRESSPRLPKQYVGIN